METFKRKLKVGKTDAFELGVSRWLNGESLTNVVITNPDDKVSVSTFTFENGIISVLLVGVETGIADIHFDYSTPTRSDCYVAQVRVIDNC